jgi:hypothetical protein
MEQSKLNKILDDHKLWLQTNGEQGERANLSYADLCCADLRYEDLRCADLSYANLRSANLRCANLRFANLLYTDLRCADLRCADLDFSVFPLWCGGLKVNIDDKQAKQLLYHLVQNVQYSKNTSETLKKLLLTKTIIKKANEFHRIGESNIKEIKEE